MASKVGAETILNIGFLNKNVKLTIIGRGFRISDRYLNILVLTRSNMIL